MKKKLLLTLIALMLVFSVGTLTYAQVEGNFNFGQMLPQMQQMHPNLTNEEYQDLYNSCHGTGGASASKNFQEMNPQNMNNMMTY